MGHCSPGSPLRTIFLHTGQRFILMFFGLYLLEPVPVFIFCNSVLEEHLNCFVGVPVHPDVEQPEFFTQHEEWLTALHREHFTKKSPGFISL